MQSQQIKTSFPAAAIIAHLASGPSWGECKEDNKAQVLEELGLAVKQWGFPEEELILYKTFRQLLDMVLNSIDKPQVQLWAVWTILHNCTHDGLYILIIVLINIITGCIE